MARVVAHVINTVPISHLQRLWPSILPLVKKLEPYHPFVSAEGILESAMHGDTVIVIAHNDSIVFAACLLERVNFPSGHIVANIYGLGAATGFYRHMPKLLEFVREFADRKGCKYLSFTGRKGWKKLCIKLGWKYQECVFGWREV